MVGGGGGGQYSRCDCEVSQQRKYIGGEGFQETTKATTTRAKILNMTMDRDVDNYNGNDCVDDNGNLRAITPWFEVVTSDERQYLPYGVRVLGPANAVRAEGEVGRSVDGSSSVSSSVLSYHNASEAAIPWEIFTTAFWVPGE